MKKKAQIEDVIEKNPILDRIWLGENSAPNASVYHSYKVCSNDIEYVRTESLWKDAQGDDLPEIDREVIALQGRKVVFAHRPNPNGYHYKDADTLEVEHIEIQTYGKGGWNIPGVTYWLDAPLPEGIE